VRPVGGAAIRTERRADGPGLRGAGGGSRSGLLDVVRLLAGFDIVAYHTGTALGDRTTSGSASAWRSSC
jgi:hypothetical protein